MKKEQIKKDLDETTFFLICKLFGIHADLWESIEQIWDTHSFAFTVALIVAAVTCIPIIIHIFIHITAILKQLQKWKKLIRIVIRAGHMDWQAKDKRCIYARCLLIWSDNIWLYVTWCDITQQAQLWCMRQASRLKGKGWTTWRISRCSCEGRTVHGSPPAPSSPTTTWRRKLKNRYDCL